jgi:hypothetical protein
LRSSLRLGLEVGAGLEVRARARVSVMAESRHEAEEPRVDNLDDRVARE